MENRRLLVTISVLTAVNFTLAHARTFYVAPSGDDGHSGAIELPPRAVGSSVITLSPSSKTGLG
jgi:hypothetical protein